MKAPTLRKYIGILDSFLISVGNTVVKNMVNQRKIRIPTADDDPIVTLSQSDLETLRQTAEGMAGWEGSVSRLLVGLLPYCGLRPGEIRQCRLVDVDLQNWRIKVSRGKGQSSYASSDFAPILQPARQVLRDFLQEREIYLNGESHDALIPLRRWDGSLTFWSDGLLHKLKGKIQRLSGVSFHIKTLRATFAQEGVNKLAAMGYKENAAIEIVSKSMRHKSTVTTQRYYARLRGSDAFAALEKAYEMPEIRVDSK